MKKTVRAEVNNFKKGLITEASQLNFPDSAYIEGFNFETDRKGITRRRLGIDYEDNFIKRATPTLSSDLSSVKLSTFKWVNVNGNSEDDFLVVQIENTLQFYDLSATALSDDGYKASVLLSSFPVNVSYTFAALEGVLVVAAGVDSFAIVSYDGTTFSVAYDRIKTRDLWGVEVTDETTYETDPTYRNAVYDQKHWYNLQNQSWGIPRKNSSNVLVDPLIQYYNDLGVYPSNSEVVWTGLQFQPVTGGVTFERIYTNLYTEVLGASVKSARGYYIIDALNRGASRMAEFENNKLKYDATLSIASVTLPADITAGGAKIVTDYAGRVWYGGFEGTVTDGDSRSPNYSNFLFFSQIVRDKTGFSKCYQAGDPSSREETEIIETDGGYLRISGAKKIISLVVLDSSLIVIADNGVWAITGGSDYGFTATSYKVDKLSNFGGLGFNSVVVEGSKIFFWSADGIYVIAKDQYGVLTVSNITVETIQTFYNNIPAASKLDAIGIYDQISKKIRWLYKEGTRFTSGSVTKELILDTTLAAFSAFHVKNISPNTVEVVSSFSSQPFSVGAIEGLVFSTTDDVLSSTDSVVVDEEVRVDGLQSVRYLVLVKDGVNAYVTFAHFKNTQFLDWEAENTVGIDAEAYFITGDQIAGDSAVAKQVPYLVMHFKRTESDVDVNLVPLNQSGCLFQVQWSFSNTINSKKWTSFQQAYRYRRARYVTDVLDDYDTGFELVTSKNKVRGRGPSFAMYVKSEPLKDCQIYGWNISLNGNPSV